MDLKVQEFFSLAASNNIDEADQDSKKKGSGKILMYSAETLKKLKTSTLSETWPNFLDKSFKNGRGVWDPDRWHQDRKRGSTPNFNGERDESSRGGSRAERPESSQSYDSKKGKDSKNPKDRIKIEEQDGIVLSPQRRSFLTGCQVSQVVNSEADEGGKRNGLKVDSGGFDKRRNEGKDPHHSREVLEVRPEKRMRGKRIGSGRLLSRNEERAERMYEEYERNPRFDRFGPRGKNYEDEHVGNGHRRDREDERVGNGHRRDREDERFGNGHRRDREDERFGNVNRRERGIRWSEDRERRRWGFGSGPNRDFNRRNDVEEPEWMTEKVEQDDMMELRGFEDSYDEKFETARDPVEDVVEHKAEVSNNNDKEDKEVSEKAEPEKQKPADDTDFNIDAFLNIDAIPGLASILADEPNGEDSLKQSRFSKFFQSKPKSPSKEINTGGQQQSSVDERRSSIQEEISLIKQGVTALPSRIHQHPSVKIPSPDGTDNDSFFFAPISPAAKTASRPQQEEQQQPNNALMDLLNLSQKNEVFNNVNPLNARQNQPSAFNQLQGNVRSVEELEADLRQMVGLGRASKTEQKPETESFQQSSTDNGDMSAFKKFAAMMENPGAKQPNGTMINGDLKMHQVNPGMANVPRPLPPNLMAGMKQSSAADPSLNTADSHLRHLIRHEMSQPPIANMDLLQAIHQAPFNYEILQLPEARNLLQALERRHTTPGALLDQFIHRHLSKLHREILCNVLKVLQTQGQLPTRTPSHLMTPNQANPAMENAMNYQQHMNQHTRISPSTLFQQAAIAGAATGMQNLAVSPSSGQRKVPSPQELQYRSQQILQNALIKRKLEEQKENFRRRNEQVQLQQQQSGTGTHAASKDSFKGPSNSPAPLNFTPTVVMKKLAADRRDSDPKPQIVPELRINSASGKESSDKEIMTPSEHANQPTRNVKVPNNLQSSQFKNLPSVSSSFNRGNQGVMKDAGSGLSRFFSPEVIAQVESGNAPSMPPMPAQRAMTLEELERHAASVRH